MLSAAWMTEWFIECLLYIGMNIVHYLCFCHPCFFSVMVLVRTPTISLCQNVFPVSCVKALIVLTAGLSEVFIRSVLWLWCDAVVSSHQLMYEGLVVLPWLARWPSLSGSLCGTACQVCDTPPPNPSLLSSGPVENVFLSPVLWCSSTFTATFSAHISASDWVLLNRVLAPVDGLPPSAAGAPQWSPWLQWVAHLSVNPQSGSAAGEHAPQDPKQKHRNALHQWTVQQLHRAHRPPQTPCPRLTSQPARSPSLPTVLLIRLTGGAN